MGRRLDPGSLALGLPAILVGVGAGRAISDSSFLWHVAAGRLQLAGGEVLRADPFSLSFSGTDWRTQSWLLELAYAKLDGWFGLAFVPWMLWGTGLLVLALLGLAIGGHGSRLQRAVMLTAAAWLLISFLSPRPVLSSYAGVAALVLALRTPRLRWVIPALVWAWAAVHGSFVFGLGLVALDGLARGGWRWIRTLLASGVTASLTAHGLWVWSVPMEILRNREALNLIQEWRVPNILEPRFLPVAVVLLALFLAASKHSIASRDLWVIWPVFLFGISTTRALPLALIVLLPISEPGWRMFRTRSSALRWRLAAVPVIVSAIIAAQGGVLDPARLPVEASEHLDPAAATFHGDREGGYLIYRFGPVFPVLVDDRVELYGAEHLESIVRTRSGSSEWVRLFSQHDLSQALVIVGGGLDEELRSAGWTEAFHDESFAVFVQPG